jgi:hypothetical protein
VRIILDHFADLGAGQIRPAFGGVDVTDLIGVIKFAGLVS